MAEVLRDRDRSDWIHEKVRAQLEEDRRRALEDPPTPNEQERTHDDDEE
jgi:hypothetical protein